MVKQFACLIANFLTRNSKKKIFHEFSVIKQIEPFQDLFQAKLNLVDTILDILETGQRTFYFVLMEESVFFFLFQNSTFTRIVWGNGQNSDNYIPPDTPDCGFFNEFCMPADVSGKANFYVILI